MPDIDLLFGAGPPSLDSDSDSDPGSERYNTRNGSSNGSDGSGEFYVDELYEAQSSSSDSGSVVTIPEDEIPNYFSRVRGRLFPQRSIFNAVGPYSLPCDAGEQERNDSQYDQMKFILDVVHFGPVQEVLAPDSGSRKTAIDVGTGTGKWVQEMATNYPHVRFIGMDLVPLATRYPRTNEQFEIGDANAALRWDNSTIHMVHARHLSHGIADWPHFFNEVSRILVPGGLIISMEWERTIASTHGISGYQRAPGAYNFFTSVNTALWHYCDIVSIAPQLPQFLNATHAFTDIQHSVVNVPISLCAETVAAHPSSAVFGRDTIRYAQSIRPLLLAIRMSEEIVTELINGLIRDLQTVPGVTVPLHVLYARRATW